MRIVIIGAGNIGSILAGKFARLGHTVLIANSRGPQTLCEVARMTGATPVNVSEAANNVDVLVLTIP